MGLIFIRITKNIKTHKETIIMEQFSISMGVVVSNTFYIRKQDFTIRNVSVVW